MMTASDGFARARAAFFRIPIEPESGGNWWWGTGFFISTDGYALTAFHNLPQKVADSRRGQVEGRDANGQPFLLEYVPMAGDMARDIALLKAPPEAGQRFAPLRIAALDAALSDAERIDFWAGRPVLVCGFPIRGDGQEEEIIAAHLRGDAPFGLEDEKDENNVVFQVQRLRIIPDPSTDLAGISGGPVIDLESGDVIGVEGSCKPDRRIVFASECQSATPAWPEAIRAGIRRLVNTPTALHDRANRLLEIPRRPWDPARVPPGVLLRPDCTAGVPFHGRDDDRQDLEAWCTSEAGLGIRLYTAAGGMGKTRLLLDTCERLSARGWRAGFLAAEAAHASSALWSALLQRSAPLLVVVDYAETRRPEIVSLLRQVFAVTSGRIRIVLLARAAGDWWDQLKREPDGVGDLLVGPATRWHSLQGLAMTAAARQQLYDLAATTFAAALGKDVPSTPPGDLDADHFERVLLLHMTALAAIDGVVVKGEQGILDYILTRERRFWTRQLEQGGSLSRTFEPGMAQAMTVITLGGGAHDLAHARKILSAIPLLSDQPEVVRRTLAGLLHDAYPGDKWIEPILPDLLGEHLVQVELGRDPALMDLVFGARGKGSPAHLS